MGPTPQERARSYRQEAADQRAQADRLNQSNNPNDKAEAARLSRLADRNDEFAQGAIDNAQG